MISYLIPLFICMLHHENHIYKTVSKKESGYPYIPPDFNSCSKLKFARLSKFCCKIKTSHLVIFIQVNFKIWIKLFIRRYIFTLICGHLNQSLLTKSRN